MGQADDIAWRCPSCGEEVDALFGQCWNCGCDREGEADPTFKRDDTSPCELGEEDRRWMARVHRRRRWTLSALLSAFAALVVMLAVSWISLEIETRLEGARPDWLRWVLLAMFGVSASVFVGSGLAFLALLINPLRYHPRGEPDVPDEIDI